MRQHFGSSFDVFPNYFNSFVIILNNLRPLGVVGGTNIDTPGGGVDYLCLSRHPQWRTTSSGPPQSSVVYNDNTRQDDNPQVRILIRQDTAHVCIRLTDRGIMQR